MEDKLPRRTDKPWGFELLIAHTPKYAGKVIFVKAGCRLSFQYHRNKDESFYIFSGKVMIETSQNGEQPASSVVQPGNCIRIPPLTRHRMKAIEDTVLFEVSTPELEDIERLDDDYGRTKPANGMV